MGTKLMSFAVCRNNLFHHRKQGCFWDIYGREQVPAALLKCQSCKRTRLPCLPPARLILEQAEAELSFWPLPWCPRSWGKSWETATHKCVPAAWWHKSSPSPPACSSLLLYWGSKLKVCTRDPGQDPPAGDIQVLVRPQKGEAIILDHGPQCLERLVLMLT